MHTALHAKELHWLISDMAISTWQTNKFMPRICARRTDPGAWILRLRGVLCEAGCLVGTWYYLDEASGQSEGVERLDSALLDGSSHV